MLKYAVMLAVLALGACSGEGSKGFVRSLTSSENIQDLTNEWEQWNEQASEMAKSAGKLDEKIWGKEEVTQEEWCSQVPVRKFYGQCVWNNLKRFFAVGPSDNSGENPSQSYATEGGR